MHNKKTFIHENFLLNNRTAEKLFHETASGLPIIDYHNHLAAGNLAANKTYSNIAQLWLNNDPYKHRAMRINGIPEHYITGDASDKDKFLKWAATAPQTIANPLFHWNCIELKKFFGVDEFLTEKNADDIWETCNRKLASGNMGELDILKICNVELICPSAEPFDDLNLYKSVTGVNAAPSIRGDALLAIETAGFRNTMDRLAELTGIKIDSLDAYQSTLEKRLEDFDTANCLLADHSLDDGFCFVFSDAQESTRLFAGYLSGKKLDEEEILKLKTSILLFLGEKYARLGWVMQLRMGALRNTSMRLRKLCGPAGGYAAIGQVCSSASLCIFLNHLEQQEALPKTILYTLNPADNESLAVLTGSFAEDGLQGKIQFGPAWWLNDHFMGIRQHLETLASYSLLSRFIGMTTDSRSVLSFTRHEYFRRILCNLVGEWAESGFIPTDHSMLKELIENIAYKNIKNYLIKRK